MFCVVEFTINIVQVSQQVPAQGITTKSAKFYIGNHHNSTTSVPHLHHICTTSAPQLHHNFILETTTTSRQFHHSLITTTYGVLCGVFTLVKFTTYAFHSVLPVPPLFRRCATSNGCPLKCRVVGSNKRTGVPSIGKALES